MSKGYDIMVFAVCRRMQNGHDVLMEMDIRNGNGHFVYPLDVHVRDECTE